MSRGIRVEPGGVKLEVSTLQKRSRSTPDLSFDRACRLAGAALQGPARRHIVDGVAAARDFEGALLALRDRMQRHVWSIGGWTTDLAAIVETYDSRCREEALNVLHDWDGKADRFNTDSIPVDVLNFLIAQRGTEPPDRAALAILLDYYFLYVLTLFALRIWDEGNADDNLERIAELLDALQGSDGSGQLFAADAETLILIATSHYEPDERGYARLLERVRTLDARHQLGVALGHASAMGSHLRFGFEATYRRDTVVMRSDNVADYPWLCFALATVMDEYARRRDAGIEDGRREALVDGLLNGLSADARAFVGHPPRALSAHEGERARFATLFHTHKDELLDAFERYRPLTLRYSPFAFFFNFSHNVLKGTVVDALLEGTPWALTLNDLLTGIPRDEPDADPRAALATTLMSYARSAPDRINGQPVPAIVYDPQSGAHAFSVTLRKLRE